MRKFLLAGAAAVSLTLAAASAHATVFTLDHIAVDLNNDDPGLVVQQQSALTGPLTFDLSTENHQTFDLFTLYTDETTVNRHEDNHSKEIAVDFYFSAPSPNSGATVNGDTAGHRLLLGLLQDGTVSWDGPASFTWGDDNSGLMTITLSPGTFNAGLFGLNHGEGAGYTVQATFDWDHDPTPSTDSAVPEPASWALMLGGFGLAGATLRRRRTVAATA